MGSSSSSLPTAETSQSCANLLKTSETVSENICNVCPEISRPTLQSTTIIIRHTSNLLENVTTLRKYAT